MPTWSNNLIFCNSNETYSPYRLSLKDRNMIFYYVIFFRRGFRLQTSFLCYGQAYHVHHQVLTYTNKHIKLVHSQLKLSKVSDSLSCELL